MEANTEANAEQSQAWNGETGLHWVQYRDRREAQLRNFSPHLFAALDLAPDARILDVGCGCGGTTLQAARRAAEGHALGVDLSAPMLAEARRAADTENVTNVAFEQADAQVHAFAPEGFDAMLSRFGVMFFADPAAAFANLAGALRPDGRLAFMCWQPLDASEYYTVPRRAICAHVPLPAVDVPGKPGPFALSDPAAVSGLLTAAGFGTIAVTAVSESMWLGTDVDDAVTHYLATPSSRAAFAEVEQKTRDQAADSLRDALRSHATSRGVELTGAAWLVTARKS